MGLHFRLLAASQFSTSTYILLFTATIALLFFFLHDNVGIFWHVPGKLGLLGPIIAVTQCIRLKKSWWVTESKKCRAQSSNQVLLLLACAFFRTNSTTTIKSFSQEQQHSSTSSNNRTVQQPFVIKCIWRGIWNLVPIFFLQYLHTVLYLPIWQYLVAGLWNDQRGLYLLYLFVAHHIT